MLERAQAVLAEQMAQKLPPGLYLVATPIGNLGDISLRALAVLARADLIAAEDTRHSRKLLSHFAIKGELTPYHEHNAAKERPRLLARIGAGFSVALISDAGTPLVSDPGYKLVREALDAGLHRDQHPRSLGGDGRAHIRGTADRHVSVRRLPASQIRATADAARRVEDGAGDTRLFRDGAAFAEEPCRHGGRARAARGGARQGAHQAA